MSDSMNCFNSETDNEIVNVPTINQQVKFMREKKAERSETKNVTSLNDTTDGDMSSKSDYQLSETGIHSSDSEWSSGDDEVLGIRRKRGGSSNEDDYDVPLVRLSTNRKVTNVDIGLEQPSTSRSQHPPVVLDHESNGDSHQACALSQMDNTNGIGQENDQIECMENGETMGTRGRGRKRLPGRNRAEQKKRRDTGLSFWTRAGVEREERAMRLGCGKNCTKNCHSVFRESDREAIFHAFWKLGNNLAQRLFVVGCAQRKLPGRTYVKHESRRQQTITYSFTKNGADIVVCKKFFLDTLSIKEDFVYTVLKCHSGDSSDDPSSDNRGKHSNY